MNEEILAGLKIALAKGESIDDAMQSFINAGYNPSEVHEAGGFAEKGFSPLPTVAKENNISKESLQQPPKKDVSSRTKWIIIILTALVLILIAFSIIFLWPQILNFIDSIFP